MIRLDHFLHLFANLFEDLPSHLLEIGVATEIMPRGPEGHGGGEKHQRDHDPQDIDDLRPRVRLPVALAGDLLAELRQAVLRQADKNILVAADHKLLDFEQPLLLGRLVDDRLNRFRRHIPMGL